MGTSGQNASVTNRVAGDGEGTNAGRVILVVDDNERMRDLIVTLLEMDSRTT